MLIVIEGPMFSGKTSELIKRIMRYKFSGKKVVLYKPIIDYRYTLENINSHDGLIYPAKVIPNNEEGILILAKEYKNYDVIGIDEIQFFPKEIALMLNKISYEKHVIAAGVNLDYKGEPWETIKEILPYADRIISLKSVCYICGKLATRTIRTVESQDRIVIGGEKEYKPVCRKHFIEFDRQKYEEKLFKI
jgi:thymidine kinase